MLDRYTRLVLAGEYALQRFRATQHPWWEERYLAIERERQSYSSQGI